MKAYSTLFLILFYIQTLYGQIFEPQILILSPNEFVYDKKFEKEIKEKDNEILKNVNQVNKQEIENSVKFKKNKNFELMTLSEFDFYMNINFANQTSFLSARYLTYRFYERFNNLLILLSEKKSNGSINELKTIADLDKMQYVLNFSKIELFKKNNISYVKISVQLYDNNSKSILINSDYEGDWNNPGFEFSCSNKSIDCTILNALSKALEDVIDTINSNSPTIKREQELAQLQQEELITNYYSKPNNQDFLKSIIQQPDSNIVLNEQYQIIIEPNKTKFIAFFIKQASAQDFKSLNENKKDENVNIITSKDINDEGFLNEIPQTYAYMVIGLKHNDKWYFEKSSVTYFDAANLEDGKKEYFYNLLTLNFFKKNTAEFNPDFWESNFFSKVESAYINNKDKIEELKSDLAAAKTSEDKEIYQSMIDDYNEQELNNKEYFGIYEIVAKQLKKEKEEQEKKHIIDISNNYFKPFLDSLKTQNNTDFTDYNLLQNDFILIFPKDENVILNPIEIINKKGEKKIRYFLFFKNTGRFLEWTYFTENPINEKKIDKIWHYGTVVMAQINTITKWDFSYKTLDDEIFWNQYVLIKENNIYRYLVEIK